MKKIFTIAAIATLVLVLQACGSTEKLYILNWGEYIDTDLIDKFEEENNVKVAYQDMESNELMYTQVVTKQAPYDIVFPSDYMVEKMNNEGLLNKIDTSKLTNYKENMFTAGLQEIVNEQSYKDYFMPYFWGSLGIMYNTKNGTAAKDYVLENGWNALFDHSGYKVSMYNSSRDSFAAAQMALGQSINDKTDEVLNEAAAKLKGAEFDAWGTDEIKREISVGVLDYGLVYSGDFFDQLYVDLEAGNEINYDIHIPTDRNNIFFDAMAIPTTSKNVDLAHKFIDFMINTDNSIQNSEAVGYSPTIQAVHDAIHASSDMSDITKYAAFDPNNILTAENKIAAEVYKDLGIDFYKKLEEKFSEVKVS